MWSVFWRHAFYIYRYITTTLLKYEMASRALTTRLNINKERKIEFFFISFIKSLWRIEFPLSTTTFAIWCDSKGWINVGDGRWRSNVLVTKLNCWWWILFISLSPTICRASASHKCLQYLDSITVIQRRLDSTIHSKEYSPNMQTDFSCSSWLSKLF